MIKPAKRKEVIKDFFVYSAGNYISQALGAVSGFLLRMFLSPYYMGIWQGLNIIKSYTSYTNLGVSRSASREIAYFRGKGEEERSERLKNVGFSFSFFMITIFGIICIAIAMVSRKSLDEYLFWGLIVMGFIIILERVESYIVSMLRAKKKFFPEALGKVINSIVNIALVLVLVRSYKLYGLYILYPVIFIFSIGILLVLSRERFSFIFDKAELKHLVKIGLPLVLYGFMYVNLTNIDRIIVLKKLGPESLGFYSIAIMIGNIIYNISGMTSIILYPRFQEKYGETDDKKAVYMIAVNVIKLIWLPFIAFICLGIWAMPLVVNLLIPQYAEGIGAMKILLVGTYFLSLSIFFSNFIVTINKQIYSLYICGAAIILNITLNLFFVGLGWGIEGVAIATSLVYIFYLAVLAYFARKLAV